MPYIDIGEIRLPYEVNWSKNRSSFGFAINHTMKLTVRAPLSVSPEEVDQAIEKKKSWLLTKIRRLQEQQKAPAAKEYLSGEKLMYKGRRYKLKAESKQDIERLHLVFKKGTFYLFFNEEHPVVRRQEKAKVAVERWYRAKADEELSQRCKRLAGKIGKRFINIEVKDLSRHWGKAKEKGIILNWRLITAPVKIQDYIIVHELVHLDYPDHDKSFWSAVGAVIPDYEERIEWLRVYGSTLLV